MKRALFLYAALVALALPAAAQTDAAGLQETPAEACVMPEAVEKNPHVKEMHLALKEFFLSKDIQFFPLWFQHNDDTLAINGLRFEIDLQSGKAKETADKLDRAFKEAGKHATSFFVQGKKDGRANVNGLRIPVGTRQRGRYHDVSIAEKEMIALMSFKEVDGFTSSFLFTIYTIESTKIRGYVAEFFGYAPEEKRVAPSQPADYITMDSVRTAIKIGTTVQATSNAGGEKTQPVKIGTTFVDGTWPIRTSFMQEILNEMDHIADYHDGYECLAQQISVLSQMTDTASEAEMVAIGFAMRRQVLRYPLLLTPEQYAFLWKLVSHAQKQARQNGKAALPYFETSDAVLRSITNESVRLAMSHKEQNLYLKQTGFTVTKNDGGRWYFAVSGRHYSGDTERFYLDGHADGDDVLQYHAEHVETGLRTGIYRLTAAVRASGEGPSGAYIFEETKEYGKNNRALVEIVGCGQQYGDIWQQAALRVKGAADRGEQPSPQDVRMTLANGGVGYGWNRVGIEGIVVRDGTLSYGVSCDPAFTGKQFCMKWLSACDFTLEWMGELPEE